MDINWIDEIPGSVQGTPVNRLRLMGMQGYFPGTVEIVKTSPTVTTITETSAEGTTVTTITKETNATSIVRRFSAANGQIIRKTTTIAKDGDTTTITESVGG